MKIKINNQWFDTDKDNICIVFNDQEKSLIARMPQDSYRFALFAEEDFDGPEAVEKWMNT